MNFLNRVVFPIVTIAVALGTAVFGTWDADTDPRRAIVHAIVAAVFAAELVSMLVRTGEGQWDQLAIWMALTRASVVNYFALMAINMAGKADFPPELFSSARVLLGVTGIVAFAILSREDIRAYSGLTRKRKVLAGSLFVSIIGYYAIISILW